MELQDSSIGNKDSISNLNFNETREIVFIQYLLLTELIEHLDFKYLNSYEIQQLFSYKFLIKERIVTKSTSIFS